MEIKYHDGKLAHGIKYDWNFLKKEYKKLKCPRETYYPLSADPEVCGYVWALSDRSRGKTTNCILLGMVMNAHYGTIVHYLRINDDMCKPRNLKDLFETILQYGYVEKITKGEWNSVYYYAKRWYYCNRDAETGDILEKDERHFMVCFGLNESDILKSAYNSPTGDIIILDEAIQMSGYRNTEFLQFSDLCSTIIRKRVSPIVYCLSNTIDKNSPWFDEFCIRDEINSMEQGEKRLIVSSEGTHIYVELLEPDLSLQRRTVNSRFFGFPNPKLLSITGRGSWATESYPRIPDMSDDKNFLILSSRFYVRHRGRLLNLKLVTTTEIPLCIFVTPATRIHDDSVVMTAEDIKDRREIFGFGAIGSAVNRVWRLYKANLFYYARNSEGALIKSYIREVKNKQREMNL